MKQVELEKLSPDKIVTYLSKLKGKEPVRALVSSLTEHKQLEAAGKALTPIQMLDLLSHTLSSEENGWKLSPLLVGFPYLHFRQVIDALSLDNLEVLKHESVTEPVQHQITLIAHAITKEIDEKQKDLEEWELSLETLAIDEMSRADAEALFKKINEFEEFYSKITTLLNKALAIAWNSTRSDLIDNLNSLKEIAHHYLLDVVGNSRDQDNPPSGLYAIVEEALFRRFGDHIETESVKENEPALEGITKLSIWYLKDYWALGLIPSVQREKDLETDSKSEQKRAAHRQRLFEEAENSLALMGLKTVSDLKKKRIFSKKTLEEYLKPRHKKITEQLPKSR
ncbi:MAG: hypothetical protein WD595_06335 [Waddliaceae bacterium]